MPYAVGTVLFYDCIFGYMPVLPCLVGECRERIAGLTVILYYPVMHVFRACCMARLSLKRKRTQLQEKRQHTYHVKPAIQK